jgi:hypothetical protein
MSTSPTTTSYTTAIQQHLPADLWEIASTYLIPEQFVVQIPDVIEMILRSASIEKKEDKQSRFNLLPLMNQDQMDRLKEILVKEKTKLAEIDAKYKNKKVEIWQQYATKREESAYIAKMDVIKKAEAQHNATQHSQADKLLENL